MGTPAPLEVPALGDQVRVGGTQSESRLEGGRKKPAVLEGFLKKVDRARLEREGESLVW